MLRTKLHDFGASEDWRFSAHIKGNELVQSWKANGKYTSSVTASPHDLFLIAPAPGANPSWVTSDEVGEGWELCEAREGTESFHSDGRQWHKNSYSFGCGWEKVTWRRRKVEPKKPKLRPPTGQELMGAWIREKGWPSGCAAHVSRTCFDSFEATCYRTKIRYDNSVVVQRYQRTAPGTHPSEGKWVDWMVPDETQS